MAKANQYGLGDGHIGEIIFTGNQLALGDTAGAMAILGRTSGCELDLADDIRVSFPIPLDWKVGTAMNVGFRWICNEAYALGSGECNFQLIYETVDQNSQVTGAGTSVTQTTGDINIPTLALQFQQSDFATTILAANLAEGDTINLDLERIAVVGGADPVADPHVVEIRVTYTRRFTYPRT